ncbi:hypothetical protein GCM10028805_00520 [Spirosoma harenae]
MNDVTEHGWIESLYPDDQAVYQVVYNRHVKARQPFSTEYRLHRRDGEYRWMLENAQPIFATDGTFSGYIGSSADVHLQHELNRELEHRVQERTEDLVQRTQQLSTLVENTPDIITRWDKNLRLLFANTAFVSKAGQRLDNLLDKTKVEIGFPSDVADPYMVKLQQVFDTGQPQEHYHQLPTSTGLIQLYSRMVPEPGLDGTIESVLAIARDITDLQQTELALQQSAQNLQAVLNSSPAAIGFLKPIHNDDQTIVDFRVVAANSELSRITKLPVQQLIGELASEFASSLWHEQTIERIQHVLETSKPFTEERHSAATDQWLLISLTKFDHGVVLTGQNITPLKQAEQQQEQLLDELEKSGETLQTVARLRQQLHDRGEFLRSTSHDLRGSFGIIQGAASLMGIAGTEEERAQMLSMLQRNLQQATKLLTELLDIARLEAGQEERHITSFDAAELLNGMIESVRPLADKRGLWLRNEGEATLLVEGDAVKIRRIAQNILLNAINYTQTGGVTIAWHSTPDDDHWQLTISDTGPGLPEKASSASGEGIGLLIVRQLCELLDCKMEINSQPASGTQFKLTFQRSYKD